MYADVRSIDRQVAVDLSSEKRSKFTLWTISTDWLDASVYSRFITQRTQNIKSTINLCTCVAVHVAVIYFVFLICICIFAVVATVVIQRVHFSSETKPFAAMPIWVSTLIRSGGWDSYHHVPFIFGQQFVKRFSPCYCTVVCPVCLSVLSCLWHWCIVIKRLDRSRWNLAWR